MTAYYSLNACEEPILFSAIARNDEKAFADLFNRYKDRVYTIAFTYTENRIIAEEIVQDVFIRVWKNRQKLVKIENFSGWIYIIARNRSLSALRSISEQGKRRKDMISHLPVEVNDAENKLQNENLEELLEIALTRLSKQQRKVFVLSRLRGHSRMEVSEHLNLAPATVSVHLTIALKSIKAFLTNHMDLSSFLLFLLCYL